MSHSEPSIEDLLKEIVAGLAQDLKRQIYPRKYFNRLRRLDTPAEKLIYLFLLVAQPQTFNSTRRLLKLSRDTVDRALKKLRTLGFVIQDENFLYWITE